MFISTKKAFQGQFVGGPRMRSNGDVLRSRSVYGVAETRKARERAANLAKTEVVAPITNAEALELIRKHRELEARLIAEERAEEMAEAKAKRLEFVRARQSALAGLNKVG